MFPVADSMLSVLVLGGCCCTSCAALCSVCDSSSTGGGGTAASSLSTCQRASAQDLPADIFSVQVEARLLFRARHFVDSTSYCVEEFNVSAAITIWLGISI
jgi:hypothetical protein